MCNHRSLRLTSDVAARLSVSSSHVYQGRFHAQLLLSAVALIGLNLLLSASVDAAGPAGSTVIQKNSEAVKEPDPLLGLVDEALAKNSQRYLTIGVNSPWEMAHGLVALRKDLMLRDGSQFVNAIDWLSNKATYKGTPIFERSQYGGQAHPYNGTMYAFEGHINQTLALLSMSNLPLTHTFTLTDGTTLTMADMVRGAQMSANREEETTWTLWFLTHYLDPEAEWTNKHGHQWSMAALVILQNRVVTTQAACGGTHNLFALAYARNAYYQKHGRLRGVWLEADQKIQEHLRIVRQLQNADGSFSTEFFKGRGHNVDPHVRMKSTGHNLEWIMMALPQQRLNEEWVRSAVRSLAIDLIRTAPYPIDFTAKSPHGGHIYHSIDALVLYRQRVSEAATFNSDSPLASLKKIEESRKLAAAPQAEPPVASASEPAKPTEPSPAVAATTPDRPMESVAQTVPKPLTININGRPVRVAELPTATVTDSPAPLVASPKPQPLSVSSEPSPLKPIDSVPVLKAPEATVSTPSQDESVKSESVPMMPDEREEGVDVPSPYIESNVPQEAFVKPIPVPQKEVEKLIEVSPMAPAEQPIEVPLAEEPIAEQPAKESSADSLELPPPIMTEPDTEAPLTPMPVTPPVTEEKATVEKATVEMTEPVSEKAIPETETKELPLPKPERERPYVTAPRDVFVPLRRRYLQNKR